MKLPFFAKKSVTVSKADLLNITRFVYRNKFAAWIVLLAGLIITVIVSIYIKTNVESMAEQEFTFQCVELKNKIKDRLDDQARILMSGAALFNASDGVTREKWRIFTTYLRFEKELPGIQGVGFSLLIPRKDLPGHIKKIRSEGFPEYHVRPEGERELYSSIIYLEPFSGRNLRAFSYDMLSETTRRTAMEMARDTDAAALSGKVALVQENSEDVQAGTLMYVPVYRKGEPVDSIEQRRAAIYGWVYSPHRMKDLMRGILGGHYLEGKKQFHIQLFDGEQTSPKSLLYENHPASTRNLWPDVSLTRQLPIDFNGRLWTLQVTENGGGFFSSEYLQVWLAMTSGVTVTLLLFALIRTLLNSREQSVRIAENLTKDLRETEARYRVLFTDAPYGIVVCNLLTKRFQYANPAICAMFGFSEEEFVLLKKADIHPIEPMKTGMTKVKDERPLTSDISCMRKDGTLFYASIVSVEMAIDGYKCEVNFFTDTTERRKIETELYHSHKLVALGIMAGGVAHEVRNPMAICSSSAQFLMEEDGTPEFRRECADNIHKSIQRASQIIENLLKYSHSSISPRTTTVNLVSLVRETQILITPHARINKIEINITFPQEPVMVSGVATLLQQVFMNLFLNAINAMPSGGNLGIDVKMLQSEVRVQVKDNGCGISPLVIGKVFDPFYTTSIVGQGTGLGLSLCHSIIKQHRGTIAVESVEGQGSLFTIILPASFGGSES